MDPAPTIQFPPKFAPLFTPSRYKVMYGGRGGARSWSIARALLVLGMQEKKFVLCAREFQNSIEESVHRVISQQITTMGLNHFYTVEKAKIYGLNGTEFSFIGIKHNTNKVRSFEGVDICWVEEAQAVSKSSWDVLRPTIRKQGSEIWLSFNPDLETDVTYQEFVVNPPPDTIIIQSNWRDNPWFPFTELAKEREHAEKGDQDAYLNTWEGHCKQVLEGAVYAKELRRALTEGRIVPKTSGGVAYSKLKPVHTFWDLGRADTMCIWFVQVVGFQTCLIDYYEERQEDLAHYFKVLQSKPYVYDTHWLPHDAKAKTIATTRSVQDQFKDHGLNVKLVPRLSVTDGILALRARFPQLYFDNDKCVDGIQALRNYRYEVVDGQFSRNPKHDWASHAADALRYMAVGLKETRPPTKLSLRARAQRVVSGDMAPLRWMGL